LAPMKPVEDEDGLMGNGANVELADQGVNGHLAAGGRGDEVVGGELAAIGGNHALDQVLGLLMAHRTRHAHAEAGDLGVIEVGLVGVEGVVKRRRG